MMQLSFWKRLLCAALTLALGVTLTACSDDDTKDDKLIPEIEVTQSLTFDCTQTQTKNLEIELNGKLNWQIKADAWIELSQTSGKGSATVAVTVPANVTSRTGTITVTATGYMGATDTGTCSVRQIKEGETLTLETTAQQLGVSITPVREAFQILERDGLISLQQNRGATVLGINEKTLREHYQVRAVLEKAACELCCENGADLSSVKNCIDTAEEALERNDVTDYANQNQSFHYEIWKAAGNGKLEKMLGELWNGLSLGLNSTEEEYARRSQKEHQQIYAALEKRDAALAGKEMEKHIYRSMEDVLTRYQ